MTAPHKQFIASVFFFFLLCLLDILPYKFCCTSNHCCHCYSVITANISSFFIEVLFRGGSVNHRFDSWKNDHVVRRDSPLINKVEDKWKHLTSIINSLSWSLKWCYSFLIFLLIKFLKDYYDRKKTIMTGRATVFPLCFFLLFLVLDDTRTRFDLQSTRLEKGPIVTSPTTSRWEFPLRSV